MRRCTTALGGVALAGVLSLSLASPAAAHPADGPSKDSHGWKEERERQREEFLAGTEVPVLTSPGVRLVTNVPDTAAISGVFAKSAPYFYVSSLDGVSVYDVSDPLAPRLAGTVPIANFENEAINYGERREADGSVTRFVLVGVDLYQVNATEPSHYNVGGGEVLVVDVTDPAQPYVRSRVSDVTSSTHTVTCIDPWACDTAYTAGSRNGFSVIDLSDLDAPREVDADAGAAGTQAFSSPAVARNPQAGFAAGHEWDMGDAGTALHTGTGGTALFDVSSPRAPRLLTTTDADGTAPGWNDFIHHNSARPNGDRFRPGEQPSLARGNVVLVTEEDYENPDCATAGSVQSWWLERADGTPGGMHALDRFNPVTEAGGGLSTPLGAFCSAHWFDVHPSGIVAQGFYQGGLRLVDARDPRELTQYGWFTAGLSEVWDAYWVPERNRKGSATGGRTNIVYTVDAVRGIDVLTVDLPPADDGDTGLLDAATDAGEDLTGEIALTGGSSASLPAVAVLAGAGALGMLGTAVVLRPASAQGRRRRQR